MIHVIGQALGCQWTSKSVDHSTLQPCSLAFALESWCFDVCRSWAQGWSTGQLHNCMIPLRGESLQPAQSQQKPIVRGAAKWNAFAGKWVACRGEGPHVTPLVETRLWQTVTPLYSRSCRYWTHLRSWRRSTQLQEYLIAWPPPPFNPSEDNHRLRTLKTSGEVSLLCKQERLELHVESKGHKVAAKG